MRKGERKKIVSKKCLNCGKEFIKAPKYTYEVFNKMKYCSNKCVGVKVSRGNKHALGYRHTDEAKKRISQAFLGSKHPRWRGGITKPNQKLRDSVKYKEWRTAVYVRDSFTCICGKVGGELNAHHIKHFSKYPELRYSVDNGITLCKPCHKLIHKK